MKKRRISLLWQVFAAIAAGIGAGFIVPEWAVRTMATFNGIFGQFLSFAIPLIILGLVTTAIADIGAKAGRMLMLTVAIAYLSTIASGLISYFTGLAVFPGLLGGVQGTDPMETAREAAPFFSISIPPLMDVMTALVFSFTLGIGLAASGNCQLKGVMKDFGQIIVKLISRAIVPLLPVYIFGIFMNMAWTGQVFPIIGMFIKIIGVIFLLHIGILLLQFSVAGAFAGRNPLKLLWNMMPAYLTALGTQSSAATIPVTLAQTRKNGVSEEVAGFVVPLCSTIHMSGSMLKIVACALTIAMTSGMNYGFEVFAGFICMLAITMVAAPGVPGGAIMAAIGLLQSMLGLGQEAQALMIALYIAMDSFGTACNVTGDGAIAIAIDRIAGKGRKNA